jgi:hypothetical protein
VGLVRYSPVLTAKNNLFEHIRKLGGYNYRFEIADFKLNQNKSAISNLKSAINGGDDDECVLRDGD